MLGSSIMIGSGANTLISTVTDIPDDVPLGIGDGSDGVILNRSTTLTADTALAGVLIGTPDTPALAANSLIISNITADGDILIAGNDGGHSRVALYFDSSVGNVYLGKPGTPGSATASGDVYCAGALEVDGSCYLDANLTCDGTLKSNDNRYIVCGSSAEAAFTWYNGDADAEDLMLQLPVATGALVPVLSIGDKNSRVIKGLFDGLTQPMVTVIEKGSLLHTATDGIADAGAASAILKHVGGFTNAVVGDIVRITAGTLCTAGWYWITTVTSADQVTLDRNYTSGDTTNVTFVTYHDFTMLSADGICTRITDGAPDDTSVEIDRDGWIIDDVGNNKLYHRSQSTWRSLQNSIATVEAHTENDTLTLPESGSVHTNLGDGDGVDLKLPASATAGTWFTFSLQAAQTLDVVIDAAGGKFYQAGVISTDDGGNDLKITADDEGESITLMSDGAGGWFVTAETGTWTVSQP